MNYILQVDFPHDGIFGEEFSKAFIDLANDISQEAGLIWKIWTENETTREAGGVYLFSNENDAKRYLEKHTKRLNSFGIIDINAKIFDVNVPLSLIDKAKL